MRLLLEDDHRLRALIAAGLQESESGHTVEQVSTAQEGPNLASSITFDALILDVVLHGGQDAGFEVAQRLRQLGNTTPVLFLTARADVESRLTGLGVGDDYIGKPFGFRELRWLRPAGRSMSLSIHQAEAVDEVAGVVESSSSIQSSIPFANAKATARANATATANATNCQIKRYPTTVVT